MICCTCSEGRANWYGKERFSREEAERDAQKHMFENEGHFATVAAVIKLSGNPAFTN